MKLREIQLPAALLTGSILHCATLAKKFEYACDEIVKKRCVAKMGLPFGQS